MLMLLKQLWSVHRQLLRPLEQFVATAQQENTKVMRVLLRAFRVRMDQHRSKVVLCVHCVPKVSFVELLKVIAPSVALENFRIK